MTTKTIKVAHIQPGQIISQHGYSWEVKEKVFDPKGNTGDQPRYLLTCDNYDGTAPVGYKTNVQLGFLVDAEVTVISQLTWRAQGDANQYVIFEGDRWLASIHVNGELTTPMQEDVIRHFAASTKLLEVLKHAVKLNSFREFNDFIPAMKAAIAITESSDADRLEEAQ